ncbi:MAG: uracil-DNA glycosylase [Myxococcaceae bacterium]|nr:uracil-DNA glycosylase [Myxococcaceae bacterium]MBH2006475.1 uracil-DNA glycosylase [Myxococcaceae bacterium]
MESLQKTLVTRLKLYQELGLNPTHTVQSPEEPADLELLRLNQIGDCQRCKLCRTRTQIVFGAGNPHAELVFVGEAPGADEDKQGLPFVGRAGQLLTKMIQAMKLDREQVYICNVIKCRPPENRNPEADEIYACEPFLKQQLALIRPKVIVGLGRYACQSLLKRELAMSSIRGQWQAYEGIDLMPTYHPAYLLRSPNKKVEAWSDLQKVMSRLGLA